VGSAAAAWPLVVHAQQAAMPVIGYLGSESPDMYADRFSAFRQGLSESGYVEGRNVAIEYLYAEGQYNRLPGLVAELVRRGVAVIIATPATAALAAKAATTTIPIVFSSGVDPVKAGLVSSLNRPGGNLTGVSQLTLELEPKRMEILHEMIPNAGVVGVLISDTPTADTLAGPEVTAIQTAARTIGQEILVLYANTEREIDIAFATLVQRQASALLVGAGAFLMTQRDQIVELAAHHAVPAIYSYRDFTAVGGLVSYGTSLPDVHRQLGVYAGRILKGERPADLPVVQPTKFELVINLKTAKALGLEIPPTLLATADDVIE
jgi:putative ABC transport system substrate-binding protein